MTAVDSRPCEHWIGAESRYCGSTDQVRRYLTGMCCPEHTPARLAGHPEPPVDTPGIQLRRQMEQGIEQ